MERIPIKTEPHLFDKPIGQLQKQIGERIDWLDHIFGLAEPILEFREGKRYKMATTFVGGEDYEQIAPCEELGNFCFFVLKDPQERVNGSKSIIKAPFYVVFWYNIKEVSSYVDERNREALKEEILATLNDIKSPIVEWGNVYENPESIFSDFSYDILDNQYMMSPYAGIKIEGTIRANISCIHNLGGDFNNDFNKDFNI